MRLRNLNAKSAPIAGQDDQSRNPRTSPKRVRFSVVVKGREIYGVIKPRGIAKFATSCRENNIRGKVQITLDDGLLPLRDMPSWPERYCFYFGFHLRNERAVPDTENLGKNIETVKNKKKIREI